MEEIGIYRSIWKNVFLLLCLVCCTLMSLVDLLLLFAPIILPILFPNTFSEFTYKAYIGTFIKGIIESFGIFRGSCFLIICGVLAYAFPRWLYNILREIINHTPYYTITDKSLIIEHENMEILFDDVEEFVLQKDQEPSLLPKKWIEIRYKRQADLKKYESTSFIDGALRYFLRYFFNYDCTLKTISVDGLSISTQKFYDLLNERLAATKKRAL